MNGKSPIGIMNPICKDMIFQRHGRTAEKKLVLLLWLHVKNVSFNKALDIFKKQRSVRLKLAKVIKSD